MTEPLDDATVQDSTIRDATVRDSTIRDATVPVAPVPELGREGGAVLANQTAKSGFWMVGARLISRVIDVITILVLAHILLPNDFGLVAIAMSLIYIVEAALELPISQALVRLPSLTPAHYDTAFTLSAMRGLGLSIIICSISVPFAHFYRDPRLVVLVCVLSFAPVARGIASPHLADFARRLDFSVDFRMEFVGKALAFISAICIALTFRNYWAIAVGTVAAPVIGSITSFVLAPYRPRLSLKELPSFSGFLGWITAAQVVSALNWQSDRLLLGKLSTKTELGLFTTANDASSVPVLAILAPIMRPLHAAFSHVRHDAVRLRRSYQTAAMALIAMGLPILVGESLIAEPAVRLLLGARWMGSAPLLRWLAVSLIPTLFAAPMPPLVMAFGDTKVFLKRNMFEISVKLPLVIYGALKFGFLGVIFARCISETATVVFCIYIVKRLIGLSMKEQLLAPWRSMVSVSLMAAVVAFLVPLCTRVTATPALAAGLFLVVSVGMAVYLGSTWALWVAAGSPSGLEAMVASRVSNLMARRRVRAAHKMLREDA